MMMGRTKGGKWRQNKKHDIVSVLDWPARGRSAARAQRLHGGSALPGISRVTPCSGPLWDSKTTPQPRPYRGGVAEMAAIG